MIRIQYLGQCGFKISMGDKNLCFDLYLSNCVYEHTGRGVRKYTAPVNMTELGDVDYYFITHEHLDHMDVETIGEMSGRKLDTVFICPYPHMHMLMNLGIAKGKAVGVKAYQKLSFGDILVTTIPEKHEEYTIIDGEHGNIGYVINYGGFQLFFAGDAIADSALAEDIRQCGKMDVMFLPINGHDWKRNREGLQGNMNYKEALDLCNYVGADLVVPMHYDLFGDNTENPAYFVDYLYRTYPFQKYKMFIPGEEIFLEKVAV